MNITDAELWELFSGRDEVPDCFINQERSYLREIDPAKQDEIEGIRNAVANVPDTVVNRPEFGYYQNYLKARYQQDCADYLVRLLWVRESKSLFGMHPLQESDLLVFFKTAFVLADAEMSSQDLQDAFDKMLESGYIQAKEEDWWQPGMVSGSGWVTLYPITLAGKKIAEKMFKNPTPKTESAPTDPPALPWKKKPIEPEQSEEPPRLVSAASGKGNRPTSLTEIKAAEAGIPWTDEPADVRITADTIKEITGPTHETNRLLQDIVNKLDGTLKTETVVTDIESAAVDKFADLSSKFQKMLDKQAAEPTDVRIVNAEPTADAHFIVNGIAAHLDRLFPSDDAISFDKTGKEWVRVDEAAKRLHVETKTLERYRNAGAIKPDANNPGIDSQGNVWRYISEGKKLVTEYLLPIASPDK